MAILHADQASASRMVGQAILRGLETGQLTDVNVQAATTYVSLRALITTTSGHADQQPIKNRLAKLMDIGRDDGTLNTTDISAAATVVGLAGLTRADTRRTWGGPID